MEEQLELDLAPVWTMTFHPEDAEACVLTGQTEHLWKAFLWADTPEGAKYWERIAMFEKSIPQEARDRIEEMLREYNQYTKGTE
jgi:hypothetical protein